MCTFNILVSAAVFAAVSVSVSVFVSVSVSVSVSISAAVFAAVIIPVCAPEILKSQRPSILYYTTSLSIGLFRIWPLAPVWASESPAVLEASEAG